MIFCAMVNKCVVFGCTSGNKSSGEKVSTFEFSFKSLELLKKWIKFVNCRDWKPTKSSVICIRHFKEEFLNRGKRITLKKNLQPYPTIHTGKALKRPSTLQAVAVPCKAPKIRVFQKDKLEDFKSQDLISNFADLSECNAPAGYKCHNENCIIFYNVAINEKSGFLQVQEALKIDKDLHVKLQFCSNSVLLPQWFVKGRTAQSSSFSMLDNFPPYLQSFKVKQNQLLIEIGNQQHYKAKAHVPFSAELIRLTLLLRYTSAKAHRLFPENFPLPS